VGLNSIRLYFFTPVQGLMAAVFVSAEENIVL
jgi:hypothetical protein